MTKRLLSHDPLTGISRFHSYDESVDAKNFVIETVQETTPIIEQNRAEFNEARSLGNSGKESFVKVASIPLALLYDLKKKGILNDPVAMKRWLNDPDNRYFRTRAGVV